MREDVRAFLILAVPVIVAVGGGLMLTYNGMVSQFNKRSHQLELTLQESINQKKNEEIAQAARNGYVQGKQSAFNELVNSALRNSCPVIVVKGDNDKEVRVVNVACYQRR